MRLKEDVNREEFRCIFCGKSYPVNIFQSFCFDCHEPLLYYASKKGQKIFKRSAHPLEKFTDFLPLSRFDLDLSLGEGNTPLIPLKHISQEMHFPILYAKNEYTNPTSSFKDRGTTIAVQKAVSIGITKIGTVSTGNMASSTAAYGAKAGLKAIVLVKDDTADNKLLSAGMYAPHLIKVKGDYGALFWESFNLGKTYNIYFSNSVDPFRIEGYKVIGLEMYSQLNLQTPDYLFVPVSSGGHLIGLMKAFLELKHIGWISKLPFFVGIQASGSSPIAKAFQDNKEKYARIEKSKTIAHAISNPDPPGGNIVLKLIRENSGIILDVTDQEILEAQSLLAKREGLFCLTASATTLAGLIKFSQKHKFKERDKIVLILTGTGLKGLEHIDKHSLDLHTTPLEDLQSIIKTLVD